MPLSVDFKDDLNLFPGSSGTTKLASFARIAFGDGDGRRSLNRLRRTATIEREFVAIGIGRCGFELHRCTGLHVSLVAALSFATGAWFACAKSFTHQSILAAKSF